jgi:hypothetical protein
LGTGDEGDEGDEEDEEDREEMTNTKCQMTRKNDEKK